MSNLPRVGITHGNINGTSCEMILRLLADAEILEICTPVIFGSKSILDEQAKALGLTPIAFNIIATDREAIEGKVNLVAVCPNDVHTHWGEREDDADKAEVNAWYAALDAYNHQLIDTIVTTPGYLRDTLSDTPATLFLQQHIEADTTAAHACFLTSDTRVTVLPATTDDAGRAEAFNAEAFVRHLRDISQSLRTDTDELRPRIAVVGDLPTAPSRPEAEVKEATDHPAPLAPEGEETANDPVRGALTVLHKEGLLAFGPFTIAQVINDDLCRHYDAIAVWGNASSIEQAATLIDNETTVGYTAGLPVVHTYPLVDASFETAGQGTATADALRRAIYAGIDILRARREYALATCRPLEKQWIPKGRDDYKLDLTKDDDGK